MPVRLSSLDRRRQILRTASGIFARRGYRGTTTREIAERAGINEALLFRHFPSKEKLYWTLIEELCSARGRRHNISKILEAGGTDLEIFTAIAREMLVRNARDTELTRLLWFTALESHTLSQRFIESALGHRKNTFILETHSEHLILRLMRRIRETYHKQDTGLPKIAPTDVSILYVEPDGLRSIVREMPLNDLGELVKSWPGGFFEEGLREQLGDT